MAKIKKVSWTLYEASNELKITPRVIENLLKCWPVRTGIGNKGKITIGKKAMDLLRLYVSTNMYFSYKGLLEIQNGKLNVLHNGDKFDT